MVRRTLLIAGILAVFLALAIAPNTALADDEAPTVAILRFGPHLSYNIIDEGLLAAMLAEGMIDEEQYSKRGEDIAGAGFNIVWGDANFDFANASFIVEQALDAGAEVLVTYSTPVTLAAVNITADLDNPPAVIFASVFDPVAAGVAQSSCIKPAHVTGIESVTRYEDIVPLLRLQNPAIQIIGTLYNSAETSGVAGAAQIVAAAEAQGIAVMERAVTGSGDIAVAAESLVDAGVEALLIPADMSTINALPILMQVASDNALPVFHSIASAFSEGATVAAGTTQGGVQGRVLAALLQGYLDGSIDFASMGVGVVSNLVVTVNTDMAQEQGIAISESLLAKADQFIKDGVNNSARVAGILAASGLDEATIELVMKAVGEMQVRGTSDIDLPPNVMALLAQALRAGSLQSQFEDVLASMHCTDEMIAQQQAALDAEA